MQVTDLPRWVYFPDTERVEWVNRLLRQVWPSARAAVSRALSDATDKGGALHGYAFHSTSLGDVCPQLGGVKVYARHQSAASSSSLASRGEVVLDVDLTWASACDLDLRLAGPRVRASVRDLCLSGASP